MTSERARPDPDPVDVLLDRVAASRLPHPKERAAIRRAANLSLRQVAASFGVSAMTVLRWERGEAVPSQRHAGAYRRLLDGLRDMTSDPAADPAVVTEPA